MKILKVHTAILLTAVEILKVYVRVRDPINQPWIISVPGLPITPFDHFLDNFYYDSDILKLLQVIYAIIILLKRMTKPPQTLKAFDTKFPKARTPIHTAKS